MGKAYSHPSHKWTRGGHRGERPIFKSSTSHPPDIIHMMNETRPSPFFTVSSTSMIILNATGEAWERGYHNPTSIIYYHAARTFTMNAKTTKQCETKINKAIKNFSQAHVDQLQQSCRHPPTQPHTYTHTHTHMHGHTLSSHNNISN